ncbi:MAG: hypothetical protein JWN61_2462 [Pseudonocardiales bacterium]|nr:hypothetical protein [Pseudonocardiales bacterium]
MAMNRSSRASDGPRLAALALGAAAAAAAGSAVVLALQVARTDAGLSRREWSVAAGALMVLTILIMVLLALRGRVLDKLEFDARAGTPSGQIPDPPWTGNWGQMRPTSGSKPETPAPFNWRVDTIEPMPAKTEGAADVPSEPASDRPSQPLPRINPSPLQPGPRPFDWRFDTGVVGPPIPDPPAAPDSAKPKRQPRPKGKTGDAWLNPTLIVPGAVAVIVALIAFVPQVLPTDKSRSPLSCVDTRAKTADLYLKFPGAVVAYPTDSDEQESCDINGYITDLTAAPTPTAVPTPRTT